MIRSVLFGAVLAMFLSGCAAMNPSGGDGDLVDRIRAELAADPELNSSMITVAERDGEVVVGGFASSLEDLNAIRDVVTNVEGAAIVRNDVILQSDG